MIRPTRACCGLTLLIACAIAQAADDPPAPREDAPPKPAPTQFEGALGAVLSHENEYVGSDLHRTKLAPAFYVRWRRVSISHASGFITRRQEDLPRGLGIELVQRPTFRFNLGLRVDNGRQSSDSNQLAGIEDVRRTVRLRSGATWQIDERWRSTAGWTVDLFGRGGGSTLDFGAIHEMRVAPRTFWSVGASLTWGNGQYMRSYHGVSAAASAINGLPVYQPGSGLRDTTFTTALRTEYDRNWSGYVGGGLAHLLGPAADSPLTRSRQQWWLSTGLARRF